MSAKPKVRPPVWTAAPDGISHGHRPGALRTLCGLRPIRQQYGWPRRMTCEACRVALETEAPTARR